MAVQKKYPKNALGRGLDDISYGKGLDALIDTGNVNTSGSSALCEIEISKIDANPSQPRHEFDEKSLEELAESIRQIGIIQPITLRQMPSGRYQIIAGERRLRASMKIGLHTIPAYIRTVEDENVIEMALVENIQREDLNAIEIALAYQHLVETTGMTQEKISLRVGKSRAAVANYMRLLKLPAQVQMSLKNKTIDMGHARALLAIESPSLQLKLFKEIERNGYSVRKVEEMVNVLRNGELSTEINKHPQHNNRLPEAFDTLRDRLSHLFKTNVTMTYSQKGKGKITIPFSNDEELERVMNALDSMTNKF